MQRVIFLLDYLQDLIKSWPHKELHQRYQKAKHGAGKYRDGKGDGVVVTKISSSDTLKLFIAWDLYLLPYIGKMWLLTTWN